MEATVVMTVFCECGRAMEHDGGGLWVRCVNARCEHYGEKFKTPTLALTPYEEPGDDEG